MIDESVKECIDVINRLSSADVQWAMGLYLRTRGVLTIAAAERETFNQASNSENTLGSVFFHQPQYVRLPHMWGPCVFEVENASTSSTPLLSVIIHASEHCYQVVCQSISLSKTMEENGK